MSNRHINLEFHDAEDEDIQNIILTKPKRQTSIFKKRLKKQLKDNQGSFLKLTLNPKENKSDDEVEAQEEQNDSEIVKILPRKRIRKTGFEEDEWNDEFKPEITKPKNIIEVLRNYGNVVVPKSEPKENLYNEGDHQMDIDKNDQDTGSELPSQAIFMPNASTVNELKERRYRAQLDELNNQKNILTLEDYDSENTRIKIDDNDDRDNDVDKNEHLNDGRLAISKSEQKLQEWMKREEIEEALYNAELSDEDKSDTGDAKVRLNLEGNVAFSNIEVVYEKISEFEPAFKIVKDKLEALQQVKEKKKRKLEHLKEETQKLLDKKIAYNETLSKLL